MTVDLNELDVIASHIDLIEVDEFSVVAFCCLKMNDRPGALKAQPPGGSAGALEE